MTIAVQEIQNSIDRLEKWIISRNYKGYEPFDGNSSFFYPLTFNIRFLRQVLQQTVLRAPFNIRPFLGVKPLDSTKGRGYIAWGYIKLFLSTGNEQYKKQAEMCLDWLDKNKSPFYTFHSWGNHFNYASRGGIIKKFEPTIVWTGLLGQVFLDAYEAFKDDRYRNIAESICQWIMHVPREKTDNGTCLSYIAPAQSSIHNSNMIGAAMLARMASINKKEEYLVVAKEAMRYSCADQLENGAWYYGAAPKYHWVDVFHTGYDLDSLKRYIDYSGDREFQSNLEKGYSYFKEKFFLDDGTPKYYDNKTYPVDIQCASQAIDTLLFFSEIDPEAIKLAKKVTAWTIKNMQHKDGHFIYRVWPRIKINTPMIHWGQATMLKSLGHMIEKIEIHPRSK